VRTVLLSVLLATIFVVATAIPARAGAAPTLRIGPTNGLSVIGTGFRPQALVTLHIVGAGVERRATVRAGARGGFVHRFPGLERCTPDLVIARTANGVSARVPIPWFIRECPPPPPLAPGSNPEY
jgi:hypothetical protein